ncbi:argininosuccinate lyase [Colletotrichum tabaci]|uniref:Argininosuccinate lyase n=1 Tax=Colletotrichum tabaci TaxID=1209068 RepID=A0AAV9TIA4_9PEZI
MIERGHLEVEKDSRDELIKLEGHLISFLKVTAARAEKEIGYKMPGYAHLQRA